MTRRLSRRVSASAGGGDSAPATQQFADNIPADAETLSRTGAAQLGRLTETHVGPPAAQVDTLHPHAAAGGNSR